MFEKIRPESQCSEGYGKNSSVWKDKVRIIMFGKIGPEFQRLKR